MLDDEIWQVHPVTEGLSLLLASRPPLELLPPQPLLPLLAGLEVLFVSLLDDIRWFLLVISKLQRLS